MAQVKAKDKKPEMLVRQLLHGMGYRYRLHRRDLPGRPDLVFPSRHKVVFVNGCFWHGHSGCSRATIPATNREFWLKKLKGNKARDDRNKHLLVDKGWEVMTVWECDLRDLPKLADKLVSFLD